MKPKPEFYINIWLKDLLYFQKFFLSCKLTVSNILIYDSISNLKFYSHSLLDQKINNVLGSSNDQVVLAAAQGIIQNMLASEDASQQPLHFLQSCGFGGLWRFAGPFTKV